MSSTDEASPVEGIVSRLRSLARAEHDDLSVAHEAADEIVLLTERLRAEKECSARWERDFIEATNDGDG